jgi:hypothetical protein
LDDWRNREREGGATDCATGPVTDRKGEAVNHADSSVMDKHQSTRIDIRLRESRDADARGGSQLELTIHWPHRHRIRELRWGIIQIGDL